MKVLIARTDRLGDVVLSLPVLAYVKERRPDWELHALVARTAIPLVENDPHIDGFWTYGGIRGQDLATELAAARFDAAVLLLYRRELASLLRRIGVPRRFGPLSKLSSWWLLNRGLWQGRSRSGRHEWAYNLQLAEKLAGGGGVWPLPLIHLSAAQRGIGERLRRDRVPRGEHLIFVHPGSGGSALDWQPEYFAEVANRVAAEPGNHVLVTGSHHDQLYLEHVTPHLDPAVEVIAGQHPLREFIGVLAAGDLMIAPSTGPLHMAAALGLATLGLYPPAPTMSPRRWGNLGALARTLVPAVDCPARRNCLGERCLLYNCLRGITVDEVLADAAELLQLRERMVAAREAADD